MPDRQNIYALNELIIATRSLADLLREAAADLHADSDLTVAERAVMLELRRNGPQTVPEVAERREVSRQSTQVTVNPLLERGLLEKLPNPRHRRSPRIGLTDAGTALIRRAMRKEGSLLAAMASELEAHEVHEAAEVLVRVRDAVRREVERAAGGPDPDGEPPRAREAEA